MKNKKFNIFLGLLGIVYVATSLFPLIKSLFTTTSNNTPLTEEWVEEPLLIEK